MTITNYPNTFRLQKKTSPPNKNTISYGIVIPYRSSCMNYLRQSTPNVCVVKELTCVEHKTGKKNMKNTTTGKKTRNIMDNFDFK